MGTSAEAQTMRGIVRRIRVYGMLQWGGSGFSTCCSAPWKEVTRRSIVLFSRRGLKALRPRLPLQALSDLLIERTPLTMSY